VIGYGLDDRGLLLGWSRDTSLRHHVLTDPDTHLSGLLDGCLAYGFRNVRLTLIFIHCRDNFLHISMAWSLIKQRDSFACLYDTVLLNIVILVYFVMA
jgi:hypothetical protein